VTRAEERLGFVARTPLEDGLRRTIDWYREQPATAATAPAAGRA